MNKNNPQKSTEGNTKTSTTTKVTETK